jgi:uncharacterized protein
LSLQRTSYAVVSLIGSLMLFGCQGQAAVGGRTALLKVVVVTGGHDFEAGPFQEMFSSFKGMAVTFAAQADDSELFEDVAGWDYDVIVLYNMSQKITPERQKHLLQLVHRRGVGIVALHHCLAAFPRWDGYADLIGGRYFLSEQSLGGRSYPASTYKHDERIQVHVADPGHPVTKGIQDFEILDEVYKGYAVLPTDHVLLQTDHPLSEKAIGWVSHGGPGRVVYLELGHDGKAYANEAYRRLVRQAIEWCSAKGNQS